MTDETPTELLEWEGVPVNPDNFAAQFLIFIYRYICIGLNEMPAGLGMAAQEFTQLEQAKMTFGGLRCTIREAIEKTLEEQKKAPKAKVLVRQVRRDAKEAMTCKTCAHRSTCGERKTMETIGVLLKQHSYEEWPDDDATGASVCCEHFTKG